MDLHTNINNTDIAVYRMFQNLPADMQECIQNCLQCVQVCEQMVRHCLSKGGEHADPDHISILQDCADICALSAKSMLRHSKIHGEICAACAEVCRACADDCEKMADDEMMKMCVDICHRCIDSCEKMATRH